MHYNLVTYDDITSDISELQQTFIKIVRNTDVCINLHIYIYNIHKRKYIQRKVKKKRKKIVTIMQ